MLLRPAFSTLNAWLQQSRGRVDQNLAAGCHPQSEHLLLAWLPRFMSSFPKPCPVLQVFLILRMLAVDRKYGLPSFTMNGFLPNSSL